MIFYQKSLWNIRSRLNYLNKVSKTQNVEELSLDLIFQNNCFGKMSKVLRNHSQPDRTQSKLSVCTISLPRKGIKTFSVQEKELNIPKIRSNSGLTVESIYCDVCCLKFPYISALVLQWNTEPFTSMDILV